MKFVHYYRSLQVLVVEDEVDSDHLAEDGPNAERVADGSHPWSYLAVTTTETSMQPLLQ